MVLVSVRGVPSVRSWYFHLVKNCVRCLLHERVVSCHVVSLGVSGSVNRFLYVLVFRVLCLVWRPMGPRMARARARHTMQFTISSFWTMCFMLHDVIPWQKSTQCCADHVEHETIGRQTHRSALLLLPRWDTEVQMRMGVFAERRKNTATVNAALSQSHKHNETS